MGSLRISGLFLEKPLLGGGWGAAANFNSITATLANIGIIGTTVFLAAAAATLLELTLARAGQSQGPNWRLAAYAAGVQNALIVAFACSVTSGIKYVFLDDWYFWAFGIAIASRLAVTRCSEDRARQAAARTTAVPTLFPGAGTGRRLVRVKT